MLTGQCREEILGTVFSFATCGFLPEAGFDVYHPVLHCRVLLTGLPVYAFIFRRLQRLPISFSE